MGTRSNVYVETEPGTYLGTYCHYDGYPSHMFPTLEQMSHDKLFTHILIAMTRGGFRIIDSDSTEYLDDTVSCVITNPAMTHCGPDFVYIKRLDGKVQWRYAGDVATPAWHFSFDEDW